MSGEAIYIGVDLQIKRGCAYAMIDHRARLIDNGWVSPDQAAERLIRLAHDSGARVVGIDAPRMPLPRSRPHYWNGAKARWRAARPSDRGCGRHCEVVIAACALARPQWTPVASQPIPGWMQLGFGLFSALERAGIRAEEVFPSAAYRMLDMAPSTRICLSLSGFSPGPKDMLDAVVAAYVLREFDLGRGCRVGGGDGFGSIVLPGRIAHPNLDRVNRWPEGGRDGPGAT